MENPQKNQQNFNEFPPGTANESGFWHRFSAKVSETTNSVTDIDLWEKVKKFTSKSAEIVEEIDQELAEKNSSYEIADYRVRGSLSVVGGMTLDIHFIKTPTARAISDCKAKSLTIIHPNSKKQFNVSKIALVGQDKAKVRCPHSGDILLIETETGKVVEIKKNQNSDI